MIAATPEDLISVNPLQHKQEMIYIKTDDREAKRLRKELDWIKE